MPAGESVEENANVVVRLLIRRPECFGPALRGEGGSGLLAAIEDAIKISEDPARDGPTVKKDRRRELCVGRGGHWDQYRDWDGDGDGDGDGDPARGCALRLLGAVECPRAGCPHVLGGAGGVLGGVLGVS